MALYCVQLMSSWIGDGSDSNPYRPASLDVQSWRDVTGQLLENIPTAPNTFVIEVIVSDAQLALLEEDDILTQEEIDG